MSGRLGDEYQDAVEALVSNPTAHYRVALDEQFQAPKLTWLNDPMVGARHSESGYRITPRSNNEFVAIGAPLQESFRDVLVGATFRTLSGPPGSACGLILRDRSPTPRDGRSQSGRFYLGQVDSRGEASIWRREQDLWFELAPWTHCDAVHPGEASNDVSFEIVGGRLTLTVNGEPAASAHDAILDQGGVGLFIAGASSDVLVERFVVHALG